MFLQKCAKNMQCLRKNTLQHMLTLKQHATKNAW